MNTLFIDTSFSDVSIAVLKDNKLQHIINENIPNKHSVYVVSYIDEILTKNNISKDKIDKILVVNGPGSFTGIRIGVTVAKTMAYLLKKKVIPVSSLKELALSIDNNKYILSLINAKNNNYYLGLYDKEYNEIVKEQFNDINFVIEIIKKYNPSIVSNEDIELNTKKILKQDLNIEKIVEYYCNNLEYHPHELNANYLKLPQALEDKK